MRPRDGDDRDIRDESGLKVGALGGSTKLQEKGILKQIRKRLT